MPHQCTNCGKVFADGSKEMLSGCPDCGGNKFQFRPSGNFDDTAADETKPDANPPDATPEAESGSSSKRRAGTPATDADTSPSNEDRRGRPVNRPDASASPSPTTPASENAPRSADVADVDPEDREDSAQASARTDVVSPDELAAASADAPSTSPDAPVPEDADGNVIDPQTDERPGLDQLREELNSQFESIKIISPGQYELNLMELFDRQEYIISLQEDGCYVIEVPDTWVGRED